MRVKIFQDHNNTIILSGGERELLAEEADYCLNYLFCGLHQRGVRRQAVAGKIFNSTLQLVIVTELGAGGRLQGSVLTPDSL